MQYLGGMALHITDDEITSDVTDVFAVKRHPDHGPGWAVSSFPRERVFDRNQAITAVTLAEVYAKNPPKDDQVWAHVANWEKELEA